MCSTVSSALPRRRSSLVLLAASTLCGALQNPSALLAHVQAACTASGPPVCIIDGNNLRGAEFFGSSQGRLRALVEGWADEEQLPALLILDHGPEERAWHVSSHAVLTMSGEGRTADDVIVRDAWYLRHELGPHHLERQHLPLPGHRRLRVRGLIRAAAARHERRDSGTARNAC